MKPSIIVHGGAWDIPDQLVQSNIRGCENAAQAGFEMLDSGATAVDAVVEAVASMEDDPAFNAGVGAVLSQSGTVELDAIVMDGSSMRSGAVAALRFNRNPVRVARMIIDTTEYSLLVGDGALAYADERGFTRCSAEDLLVGRELEDYQEFMRTGVMRTRRHFVGEGDTVGACAVDGQGHVACATSTGGIPRKHPGRVGDSPIVGSGGYADDSIGAASSTGWGEQIMSVVLSKTALDLREGTADSFEACRAAIGLLEEKVSGLGGVIMVDTGGRTAAFHNTPRMAYAFVEGLSGRRGAAISAPRNRQSAVEPSPASL